MNGCIACRKISWCALGLHAWNWLMPKTVWLARLIWGSEIPEFSRLFLYRCDISMVKMMLWKTDKVLCPPTTQHPALCSIPNCMLSLCQHRHSNTCMTNYPVCWDSCQDKGRVMCRKDGCCHRSIITDWIPSSRRHCKIWWGRSCQTLYTMMRMWTESSGSASTTILC